MNFEDQTFTPCDCAALAYKHGGKKVPHWRALVDSRFLNHAALDGKDCTVEIASIKMAMVETNTGKGNKAHVFFKGKATVAHVAVRLAMHQRPRPAVEECR